MSHISLSLVHVFNLHKKEKLGNVTLQVVIIVYILLPLFCDVEKKFIMKYES